MSTTTQILFNSPALHSLKREQLVRLCKVHSLKANGKNVELVDRLKQYAQTLPRDAPLSIAARKEKVDGTEQDKGDNGEAEQSSEEEEAATGLVGEVRQVMESIEEMDEKSSSQGTMSSIRSMQTSSGEFGTANSKSSTVGSSIKALASSLGLKRALTSSSSKTSLKQSNSGSSLKSVPSVPGLPKRAREQDDLLSRSKPYSAIPPPSPSALPQTDHFTFDPALSSNHSYNPAALTFGNDVDPLPGHVLRPGQPAPEHARLSLGQGPATPSAAKAPTTTLRLVTNPMGSLPSMDFDDLPSFGGAPATPQLKPFHTTYDLIMDTPAVSSLYPSLKFSPPQQPKSPAPPAADEDVEMPGAFDSPTRDTVKDTSETASNSLSPTSPTPEPFIFGSPKHRVSNAQFSDAARSVWEEMNKRLQAEGGQSIDGAVLASLRPGAHSGPAPRTDREIKPLKRTSIARKFDEAHEAEFEKMESIKDVLDRRAAAKKEVTPPMGVSGKKRKSNALEVEGAGPAKRPSGVRPSNARVISSSRRNLPGAFGGDESDDEERPAPEGEARAKKPRLSYANVPQDPEEQARKEKEREAIKRRLEANKQRRRSSVGVNKGRPSIGKAAPKAKPSRFGFLSAAKSVVSSVWNRGKTTTAAPPSAIPKPTVTVNKAAPAPKKSSLQSAAHPDSSVASKATSSKITSSSKASSKDGDITRASITSNGARARSPLPAFNDKASKRTSAAMGSMGPPPVPGGSRSTRNSSTAGASSMGTRTSATGPGRISSFGTKGTLGGETPRSSIASRKPSVGSSNNRGSTSSRLLAPTASSLAKQQIPASTASKLTSMPSVSHLPRPCGTPSTPTTAALNPITNVTSPTPRLGGIFSSGIPMPSPPKPSTSVLSPGSVLSPDHPKPTVARKPTITRKPRISRGRVIAKLASQRAAAGGVSGSSRLSAGASKTRSSLGAKVARQSLGAKAPRASNGVRPRASAGEGAVMMSAKKRARQSEYMRRKSRAAPASDAMDVDA